MIDDIAMVIVTVAITAYCWLTISVTVRAYRPADAPSIPEEVMSAAWREVNGWEVAFGLEPTSRPRPLGDRARSEQVDISWL